MVARAVAATAAAGLAKGVVWAREAAVRAGVARGSAVEARVAGNAEMYTRGSPHTRECIPKRTSCSTGWSGQSSTRRCRSPQAVGSVAVARVTVAEGSAAVVMAAVGTAAAAMGLVAVVKAAGDLAAVVRATVGSAAAAEGSAMVALATGKTAAAARAKVAEGLAVES